MELLSRDRIRAARGITPADAVFKNARIFNPFTCTWDEGTLAVKDGIVLGIGEYRGKKEYDLGGSCIVPGLIDAHVHIESSLLTPREYARLVAGHGTTTVIADPHEIANVAGSAGIAYMLAQREGAAIDILYLLPSCVPATPVDAGGAILGAGDLRQFLPRNGIIGLGEMMNVPGVLAAERGIGEKLALSAIRDGHAPLLSGNDLNAYILAGLQSDHECTRRDEAAEKLRKGLFIYLREGSTEQNISDLIPVVTPHTAPRCCFATDDCHADLLMEQGHIDRCVRKAIACGLEPELALRMATLSPAERFGLTDRGALSPGRRADFCVIDDPQRFFVKEVVIGGRKWSGRSPAAVKTLPVPFHCTTPPAEDLEITGGGTARVIGLVPHQILTESLRSDITAQEIPDLERDLLKVVVCNRYRQKSCGLGLVHGFGFRRGAIACSISHDAHNIVAVGVTDHEIRRSIDEVIRSDGALAAVISTDKAVLHLDCAGLMSTLPAGDVVRGLQLLHAATGRMEGISNPFMYLSFLALTVIPALRITDRGMYDVGTARDVPLFAD